MSTIIPGRSKETALKIRDASEKAGVDFKLVRTVQKGYVVPDAVAAAYLKLAEPKAEKVEEKTEEKPEPKAPAKKTTTKTKAKQAEESKPEEGE